MKLTKLPPEHELDRLWGVVNGDKVYDGYAEWEKMIEALTRMLEEKCAYVVAKAKDNDEKVKVVHHRQWYPYFYRYVDKNWRIIKREELEEWLLKYLTGEQVLSLISLSKLRANTVILFGYMHKLLIDLGLVESEG